mmetsp:Transcript_64147/g.150545  ORF Transcript_64147/g.150545 Transcript_64147/m.150545 type:complete len:468 (+) Transcript_64147:77-1480(+)
MAVEDPQLLQARPRENWRLGTAVEVHGFDTTWSVGCIVSQEGGSFLILLSDSPFHRQVPRDDPSLAPIGKHIRDPPPGWEVLAGNPPHLAPAGNRSIRLYTLEDAWSAHMEQVRKAQAARPRPEGSPAQLKGAVVAPPAVHGVKAAASNGVHFQAQPEALSSEATTAVGADELALRLQEAESRVEDHHRRLQQALLENRLLREERDALRQELAEARDTITRLHGGVGFRSVSQASLPTSPSQRLLVTSPLGLQQSSSSSFIKNEPMAPAVPPSWQPPTSARETPRKSALSPVSADGDGEEGDMFPGPDFHSNNFRQPFATVPQVTAAAPPPARQSDKPVEIIVSVPRASADEIEVPPMMGAAYHPSRSFQSLQAQKHIHMPMMQHQVTRLPSAPAPQSQAFASAPVQVSCAGGAHVHHSGGVRLMPSLAPSAPASLAAPAGGVRMVRPLAAAPKAPPMVQAVVSGYR